MPKQAILALAAAALFTTIPARAQQPPKAGPEHELLKQWEGTWDTVLKAGGMEHKGTTTFKMKVGGLWLVSNMELDFGGQKFFGHGLDTYDAGKKKFVSVWCDSMSTMPMLMEGSYDAAKKTMTMTGNGPGMDGKMTTWRSVTEKKDDDNAHFRMYIGGGQEPMFTVDYKRRR